MWRLTFSAAVSYQAIHVVMPDLFRHLSINGRDPDPDQLGQHDSRYFEIASSHYSVKTISTQRSHLPQSHFAGNSCTLPND